MLFGDALSLHKFNFMKKFSLWICLFLFVFGFAQKPEVDTAQVVFQGRVNIKETLKKPYVIFISVDGFRYDYIKKYKAKTLQKLAKNGVWAKKGMYPSYPSITFPNHYSLVTGMYPSHHGLVDNVFYDPNRDEAYIIGSKTIVDGSWYGGLPLWGLAETQGMRAASLFWVGSESDAAGVRPTYYYHYHENFSGKDKAKIIKNWLQLPEEQRPHFITLYFPEVDHAGHTFGPDAKETKEAVHYIDNAIQDLVNEVEPLNLPINFIFVSDHGMIRIDPKNHVPLPEIDENKFVVLNSGTITHIYARNTADIQAEYERLKKLPHKDYDIYLASEVPQELHYSSREDKTRRIGDIIFIPHGEKYLVGGGRKPPVGAHGYNPRKIPEMKATFFAWGPNFKSSEKIESFENVNIYPLIAKILNLKIDTKIDGDISVLENTLKK